MVSRLNGVLALVVVPGLLVASCAKKPGRTQSQADAGPDQTQGGDIAGANRPKSATQLSETLVIEPGVGIGKVRFGQTFDEVRSILGQPVFSMDRALEYSGYVLASRGDERVATISCGDLKGPNSLVGMKYKCRTAEGIGIGSSERQVTGAYGQPDRRTNDDIVQGAVRLWYGSKLMELRLMDDKVYYMWFGTPKRTDR